MRAEIEYLDMRHKVISEGSLEQRAKLRSILGATPKGETAKRQASYDAAIASVRAEIEFLDKRRNVISEESIKQPAKLKSILGDMGYF